MSASEEIADLLERLSNLQFESGRIAERIVRAHAMAGLIQTHERPPAPDVAETPVHPALAGRPRSRRNKPGDPPNRHELALHRHDLIRKGLEEIFDKPGPPLRPTEVHRRLEKAVTLAAGDRLTMSAVEYALKRAIDSSLLEQVGRGLYQRATPNGGPSVATT